MCLRIGRIFIPLEDSEIFQLAAEYCTTSHYQVTVWVMVSKSWKVERGFVWKFYGKQYSSYNWRESLEKQPNISDGGCLTTNKQ